MASPQSPSDSREKPWTVPFRGTSGRTCSLVRAGSPSAGHSWRALGLVGPKVAAEDGVEERYPRKTGKHEGKTEQGVNRLYEISMTIWMDGRLALRPK